MTCWTVLWADIRDVGEVADQINELAAPLD